MSSVGTRFLEYYEEGLSEFILKWVELNDLPQPLKRDKHMDNYELTPNTTILENPYDEYIIKVEITFVSDKPKSAGEIKKLLDTDHVLIESTKVFHHKGRKKRKK